MLCYQCKTENKILDRVGRRDTCAKCDADLHVCKNCNFYDVSAYNECKEPSAERVLDKTKSNFCDYFTPETASGGAVEDPAAAAKAKLAALFKK